MGCQTLSTRSVDEPIKVALIPEQLKRDCAGVVNIPDKDLTREEAVKLWAKDREALGRCVKDKRTLNGAVKILEEHLRDED